MSAKMHWRNSHCIKKYEVEKGKRSYWHGWIHIFNYRFSRPFSSPLHSISSIFNSISSGEAYCVQILSSISSNCHSHSFFVNQIKKFSIHTRQYFIVTEICPCRLASYECNDQIRHSFKQIHYFVIQIRQVLLGLYIWETMLIETLTKMNANRRKCFCCLVLSYCDRRIWIAVDENGWQSTKLNHNVFKIDRPKTKLKRAFAHSRVSGTKLKTHFLKLNEEMTKMGGKTYVIGYYNTTQHNTTQMIIDATAVLLYTRIPQRCLPFEQWRSQNF